MPRDDGRLCDGDGGTRRAGRTRTGGEREKRGRPPEAGQTGQGEGAAGTIQVEERRPCSACLDGASSGPISGPAGFDPPRGPPVGSAGRLPHRARRRNPLALTWRLRQSQRFMVSFSFAPLAPTQRAEGPDRKARFVAFRYTLPGARGRSPGAGGYPLPNSETPSWHLPFGPKSSRPARRAHDTDAARPSCNTQFRLSVGLRRSKENSSPVACQLAAAWWCLCAVIARSTRLPSPPRRRRFSQTSKPRPGRVGGK